MLFTAVKHLIEALLTLKVAPFLTKINIINDTDVFQRRSGILRRYSDWLQAGVRLTLRAKFLLLHVVQTGTRVHPASYLMGTGEKAAGA
jgi:hypothetical protein